MLLVMILLEKKVFRADFRGLLLAAFLHDYYLNTFHHKFKS